MIMTEFTVNMTKYDIKFPLRPSSLQRCDLEMGIPLTQLILKWITTAEPQEKKIDSFCVRFANFVQALHF